MPKIPLNILLLALQDPDPEFTLDDLLNHARNHKERQELFSCAIHANRFQEREALLLANDVASSR